MLSSWRQDETAEKMNNKTWNQDEHNSEKARAMQWPYSRASKHFHIVSLVYLAERLLYNQKKQESLFRVSLKVQFALLVWLRLALFSKLLHFSRL